jgi:hypothetical protein
LLEVPDQPFPIPGDLLELVVRDLSPGLAKAAFQGPPVALDAVPIHGVT